MSRSIQCGHCQAVWTPADSDEQARCPECRRRVSASAADPDAALQASPPPVPKRSRRDEEDDDPFPVRIKKRPRARTSHLALALILVAVAGCVLLACIGSGIAAYFLFFSGPRIAGQWELTDPPLNGARVTIDFRGNGTGMIDGPAADVHFDYTLKTEAPMTLEWRITRIESKRRLPIGPFARPMIGPIGPLPLFAQNQNLVGAVERFRVAMEADTLKLTNQNDGGVLTFRRVR